MAKIDQRVALFGLDKSDNRWKPLELSGSGSGVTLTVSDNWDIQLLVDDSDNDSDKTFVVPTGYEYQVLSVWVEYAASGAAGDRQVVVEWRTVVDNIIGQQRAGVTQAASETRYYMFGSSLADITSFRDTDYLMTPLPPGIFLEAGQDIRVYDNNAVAAAADDMIVRILVARREV